MTQQWIELASSFLHEASGAFSNNSCNDWEWPNTWSLEDRNNFIQCLNLWEDGSDPYPLEQKLRRYAPIADSEAMKFLAAKLIEVDEYNGEDK